MKNQVLKIKEFLILKYKSYKQRRIIQKEIIHFNRTEENTVQNEDQISK